MKAVGGSDQLCGDPRLLAGATHRSTDPLFPYHDQLAEDEFVNVGGGFSWALNESIQIFGLYTESIEGRNSHKVDHRVTLGVSYGTGFGRY
jgi:hypothetical protein